MFDFIFENLYEVICVFVSFVSLVVAIVIAFKTGNKKFLLEVLDKMKFRTMNYQDKTPFKGQTFDRFSKVYRLNKSTNELEDTGEVIDIQEMVNSSLCNCLSQVLDRLMPQETEVDVLIDRSNEMADTLDVLQSVSQVVEKYSKEYNIEGNSILDVFSKITAEKEKVDKLIESKKTKSVEDNSKEVEGNA